MDKGSPSSLAHTEGKLPQPILPPIIHLFSG